MRNAIDEGQQSQEGEPGRRGENQSSYLDDSESTAFPMRERPLRIGARRVTLLVPGASDPRLIELIFLIIAVWFRVEVAKQPLSSAQLALALITPVVLDVVVTYVRRKVIVAPASALISGLVIALILQSSLAWPYALGGAIAILSKHLIRGSDRNVFNPSAVALVVLLAAPHLGTAGTETWKPPDIVAPIIG